jgi:predicted GNAT family acetyltransferase
VLTQRHGVRLLGAEDLDEFLGLVAKDPVVNVFVDYRARTTQLLPRWLGGEVWGRFSEGRLVAACHAGANLVPVQCTVDDAEAFAERALTRRRSITTLVGPQRPVDAFWQKVAADWGTPRDIRTGQPHLEIASASTVAADPEVRLSRRSDLDELYPACVSMYTEEVGISPEYGGGAELYRARISQLISRGWSFVRFDGNRVVFKAEVACVSPYAAQIQGVYVAPDQRGQGLATAGMAAVIQQVRETIAPIVSLYVNEWNLPARRVYEKVGFVETARFTTIMF